MAGCVVAALLVTRTASAVGRRRLGAAWNKATLIVFDDGVSREDAGLYVDFGHQF